MSVEARRWAWRQRGLNASAHLLLLRLADLCKADTCYRSDAELADDTGLPERTIIRRRDELIKAGLIEADTRRQHMATAYKLMFQTCQSGTSETCQNGTSEQASDTPECQVCGDSRPATLASRPAIMAPQTCQSGTSAPYIQPEEPEEPETCVRDASPSPAGLTPGQHATRIFSALCDGLKHKPGKSAGRAMTELTSLVQTHGHEAVAAAFEANHLRAVRAARDAKFPLETFAGMWSNACVVFEILTDALPTSKESTPCKTENAWADLPRPGQLSKPSSADKTTVAP